MLSTRCRIVAVCSFSLLGVGAAGATNPDGGALLGPNVADEQDERSLISRGFSGELLPLDAPPAIAALDLFEFDEATERALHELLAERSKLMDDIVLSNIELLGQIETVMAVGAPSEKLAIIQQGLAALRPARSWGRLRGRVAEVLPEPIRLGYEAVLHEYEEARYAQARRSGTEHRFEHRMARYWEDISWEIERAAERVFEDDEDGDKWLERLSARLGLTPMQEGEIRAMAERFYIDAKGRPTKEQEIAFIAKIRSVMTIEQRWKFTAMMLRGELDPGSDDG